ncbi:MAG: hypothetical protein K5873_08555 [Treponema sp.]|nr:hypothetical protein [Treponema sp.]
MKKGFYQKVKIMQPKEYRRLSRILKLYLGGDLSSTRSILWALEVGCQKLDQYFTFEVDDFCFAGAYKSSTHTVLIDSKTYNEALEGNPDALFTVVHEISHWALITLFHVYPKNIVFELDSAFSSTTDAELYADTFSCYMMMPSFITRGCKKSYNLLRRLMKSHKERHLLTMPLIILSKRRCCRAIGSKKSFMPSQGKKIA